ncbi:hypothetical protein [Changchengzhania lutea]|uniref:hypothetical protein n=1 Tax=Changchengzhania lutea TaxID=2049305 RepID=UPI00115DBE10|nr:hypothetical protein [Changchengzhania lutea]
MSKTTIEDIFKNLENEFDIETPNSLHKQRFIEKLKTANKEKGTTSRKQDWKPLFAIAASLLLLITLVIGFQKSEETSDLSSVSPKMEQTQDFYTLSINEELKSIQAAASPEVQALIADTMTQLNILEKEYNALKEDLKESGQDQRVIYAMISNFQYRTTLLQNTLEQINSINQLKTITNETSTTI